MARRAYPRIDDTSNCLLRRGCPGWIIEPCPTRRYLQCFLSDEERKQLNSTNPLLTLRFYIVSMHRTERLWPASQPMEQSFGWPMNLPSTRISVPTRLAEGL